MKFEDLKWKESSYIIAFIVLLFLGLFLVLQESSPVGFSFVTLGFAILSVGLAFKAIGIAKESDKKMEANANESFLKIWDTFGDKRILFLNQIRNRDLSSTEYMAWKCKTYMDRAFDLMETSKIKLENRKKMYKDYFNLLKQFPWQGRIIDGVLIKDNVVTLTDAKNLLNAYRDICKNHLYDEKSDELIHLFDPFVKDIDTKITVDKQIDEFISEINGTKKILEEIYGKQRRYPFMRLDQAKQLSKRKGWKKKESKT